MTELEGKKVSINFSGGVTMVKPDETVENLWEAIGRADDALFKAKEDEMDENGEIKTRGRDRILAFNSDETKE